MSRVFPGGPRVKPEPKAAPTGPGLRPWALDCVAAPPPLSGGGDKQPHTPEPQAHLLQHGKCCPAYFLAGSGIWGMCCERLQAWVLPVSLMRQ